jgi:hypothetical protein
MYPSTTMISKQILVLALAFVPSARSSCIDLTAYASTPDEVSILTGGGNVSDNTPVIFDIPSDFVSGEVVYCLENITIPNYVGLNKCEDSQRCWLAVGLHAGQNNDASATQACRNSGDTKNCYECTCTGSSMKSGSSEYVLYDGCGLRTDSRWGASCRDVTNGRVNWDGDGRVVSNSSTVHVHVCPETIAYCNVCQGGLHPSFRVGVQWISDLEEQCFSHPFENNSPMGLSTSSIIGIVVGSAILVAVFIGIYYIYGQRKQSMPTIPPTPPTSPDPEKDSPLMEEISCSTENSR